MCVYMCVNMFSGAMNHVDVELNFHMDIITIVFFSKFLFLYFSVDIKKNRLIFNRICYSKTRSKKGHLIILYYKSFLIISTLIVEVNTSQCTIKRSSPAIGKLIFNKKVKLIFDRIDSLFPITK